MKKEKLEIIAIDKETKKEYTKEQIERLLFRFSGKKFILVIHQVL